MLRRIPAFAALLLLALSGSLMAQTNVSTPNQTWPVGRTYVYPTKNPQLGTAAPVGQWIITVGPTANTIGAGSDWQSGSAGRRIHVAVETSDDGGQTWVDGNAGNNFATGAYGKGGFPNAPTISIVDFVPNKTILFRVAIDCYDAPVTCGFTAVIGQNN